VRQEAIAGLSRLRDERVVPALLSVLEQPNVPEIMIEAALEMLHISESASQWTPRQCAAALRRKFAG